MAGTESKLDDYVCTKNCIYKGNWYSRGDVIHVVAGTKVEHACFEKKNKTLQVKKSEGMFNPSVEAIEKKRVSDAMAGMVTG